MFEKLAPSARLSGPVRGALWMIFFCATMATLTGMIRHLQGEIHALEMAFFRNFFGWVFVLPFIFKAGLGNLKTERMGLHVLRAIFGVGAMSLWFVGVTMVPLAEATALNFTVPLFSTIGAVLFLGEVVRIHRWLAIGVGFIGAMIIIRPGVDVFEMGAMVVLCASLFIAAALLTVKKLSNTEHSAAIVFYMGLFMTPLSLLGALPVWTWPTLQQWPWLITMGLIATIGQLAIANAMKAAPASYVMPFNFTIMLFASAIGYVFYNEVADVWTWAGAGVIFSSTLYIAHREARRS